MNILRIQFCRCRLVLFFGAMVFPFFGFGQTNTPSSVNNAAFVRVDGLPSFVRPNEPFEVTFVLRNTGETTWNKLHFLATRTLGWKINSVPPVARKPVRPGEETTVKLSCRAPDVPGPYPFWWRMAVNDNGRHELFGDWFQKIIVVSRAPRKVAAQPIPQYSVRLWQTEDGLPQNSVQAAMQTRDGYIWVGTQNGLARFDGMRFTVFHPRNVPEMTSAFIFSLAEGIDGSLWIGTYNGGLLKMKSGLFTGYKESDGLASDAVRAVIASTNGTVWIGTTNGLSQFRDGKFSTLTTKDGLAHNVVRGLAEDRKGGVWAATADGVNRIVSGKVNLNLRQKNGLLGSIARTMATDRAGNVWAGTTGGLTRFQQVKTNVVLSSFSRDDADNNITAIHEDKRGNIWVGTYGGLSRIVGGQWITEKKPDGSAFDLVTSIFEDREGNIWVGLKEGLARLQIRAFSNYTMQQGLTHNNVMSVCEDRNGALWIGTWGGGLNRLFKQKVTPFFGSKDIASQSLILSVHEDASGRVWAGMDYNGGLFRIENGTMTHFGTQEGLHDTAVRVIQSDRAGNLWLGTSQSLLRFRDGKFARFTTTNGLAGEMVRAILEDSDGVLWIGTGEGLSKKETGDRSQESGEGTPSFTTYTTRDGLPHNAVIAIYEDKKKDLWFGTGGGICRMRRQESEPANQKSKIENQKSPFTSYTSNDGLFNDEVLEILEDDLGYFWMSCRYGVFRIAKKEFDEFDAGRIKKLSCQSFGQRDGMVSIDCNGIAKPAGWKSRDGRLWFPTTKGLTVVDPRLDLSANTVVPAVVIEEVIADKQRVTSLNSYIVASEKGSRMRTNSTIQRFNDLTIQPGRGELEFHYTALSFSAPEKNQFRYKLEGYDRDWVEAGARRTAYYNNLAPGNYTFRVTACNNAGLWNSFASNVKFSLQPHFWQTLWFQFSVTAFGLCLVAATARYATKKRMQARLLRLEQEHAIEKERTRIAQDMHDDLGVRLSEILLLSDMTSRNYSKPGEVQALTGKITHAARELVDNLDAIVWAVNPKNDSLDRFSDYLCENVPMYLKMSGIQCAFDVPPDLPARPLSSELRHNLFLVVKEALHNVVKHAQATKVEIFLRLMDNTLVVGLADNGKGFPEKAGSNFGNGLSNMQERMKRIGGCLELSSEPGKGTRVRLEVPLHR